jgi:hypothetical protein
MSTPLHFLKGCMGSIIMQLVYLASPLNVLSFAVILKAVMNILTTISLSM